MAEALASGQIQIEKVGEVAVVASAHRAATGVGYMLAPVVVALNPEFRVQGGKPHRNSRYASLVLATVTFLVPFKAQ